MDNSESRSSEASSSSDSDEDSRSSQEEDGERTEQKDDGTNNVDSMDVVAIDESDGTITADRPPANDQQPPPSTTVEGTTGPTGETSADAHKSKRQRQKERKKKESGEDELADPRKIIDKILSRTTFQTANLSHIVDAKFYSDESYNRSLCKVLRDVRYEPTVARIDETFFAATSVHPTHFRGTVCLDPSAFLSLKCINEIPPKRWTRNRGKKSKKGKKKAGATTTKNTTTTDPTHKKERYSIGNWGAATTSTGSSTNNKNRGNNSNTNKNNNNKNNNNKSNNNKSNNNKSNNNKNNNNKKRSQKGQKKGQESAPASGVSPD